MEHDLEVLEVPQVSVDFLEKDPLEDLRGREKITMLSYLLLDRISNLFEQQ